MTTMVELLVKLDNTDPNRHQRWTYLKFDLSGFSSVSNATLRLYLASVGTPTPIDVVAFGFQNSDQKQQIGLVIITTTISTECSTC